MADPIQLSREDDKLLVTFPRTAKVERPYTIFLPATPAGYASLDRILRRRETEASPAFASPASPTQWDVLKNLAASANAEADAAREARRAEAEEFLRELGIS